MIAHAADPPRGRRPATRPARYSPVAVVAAVPRRPDSRANLDHLVFGLVGVFASAPPPDLTGNDVSFALATPAYRATVAGIGQTVNTGVW
jgi:hypothetical protein